MSNDATEKQSLLNGYGAASQSSDQEPSLSELRENVSRAQREYMRAWSRSTNRRLPRTLMLATTLLLAFVFIGSAMMLAMEALEDDDLTLPPGSPYGRSKVALEAHIMSKCPDARDCLREMILPAMVNVSEKVDFKLSYIGSATGHDDGVLCMHGPQECLGNIIELCAAKLYPDPKIYLGFTMCLSKNYQEIAKQELVEDCALEHGISFQELNNCATEEDGKLSVEMLQDSFERSARANVSTSCTIRVDNQVFCVRDDGKWKDCAHGDKPEDLTSYITQKYGLLRLAV